MEIEYVYIGKNLIRIDVGDSVIRSKLKQLFPDIIIDGNRIIFDKSITSDIKKALKKIGKR
jgi:hypothetical protein